jgi:tRNA threonylcarbamoyladenosine biosynthesis protein TsaB
MKVLGIDTSTMIGAIGIVSEEEILAEVKLNVQITFSEILLSSIDSLLKNIQMKIEEIDGFAIAIGPGSFTGLRIGVSTIKGLIFALNKPVTSIITLDCLASFFPYSKYPIGAILDAKKEEVYFSCYDTQKGKVNRISEYLVISPEKLGEIIKEKTILVGSGVRPYKEKIEKALKDKAVFIEPFDSFPSGALIARLGMEKIKKGHTENIETLEPFYIRKSEQELKKRVSG